MSAGNTVIEVGNTTRDPELRFTPGGSPVCNFGIAVNRRWMNKQTNEWEEDVSFFDVICWADLAENVAETVTKGMRVVVFGRLDQRSWDDKDSGDKRYKIEIVADEVGPSLRWASAQVTKNERNDNGGGNRGGGGRSNGGDRGDNRGRDVRGGGGGGGGGNRGGGGNNGGGDGRYDEEPF